MTKKNTFRPSPALVIACIALFAALTGSAIAAGVGKNTVRSPQIVDGTIRTVDLRDNAVAAGKIAPDAVDTDRDRRKRRRLLRRRTGDADRGRPRRRLGHLLGGSRPVADRQRPRPRLGRLERAAGRLRPRLRARRDHPGRRTAPRSKPAPTPASASHCPAGTIVISGGNTAGDYRVALAGSVSAAATAGATPTATPRQRHHPHRLRLLPLRRQQQLARHSSASRGMGTSSPGARERAAGRSRPGRLQCCEEGPGVRTGGTLTSDRRERVPTVGTPAPPHH